MALAMTSHAVCAQTRKPARNAQTKAKTGTTKNDSKATEMSAHAKALFNDMLPNTQRVFVIDSIVTDKDKVVASIPLPKAYGQYADYDSFFGTSTGNHSQVYVNGFGNRCYYTKMDADSISRLYVCDKLGDRWGTPTPVSAVNDNFTDISFPFMSSDGQTLYFAGVSATEGLGHRDIYMTKYDADEGTFLQAENIGLPFNSHADDFAYIVADADKTGWFATTRNQPEGKACIYIFVPSDTRQNYNADDMDEKKIEGLARLTCIRETWPTTEMRDKAMARYRLLQKAGERQQRNTSAIHFIVDDNTTYTDISQFASEQTRQAYRETVRLNDEIEKNRHTLDAMRTAYHAAKQADKTQMGQKIAALEQKVEDMQHTLKRNEAELRKKESAKK